MDFPAAEEYGLSRSQLFHQEDLDHDHDHEQSQLDLRKGPWTVEEDSLLFNYVSAHGEGRWNSLARHAGLRRTGKSCRLRWLNYLRPSVRRGNITLQEQLLILELHSRWGNRWSKIAQYLPGRTDNEIKNYWRTRVQKQAKQLKCDVNSKQFQDAMRYVWIPRLVERIHTSRPASPTRFPDPQPENPSFTSDQFSCDPAAGGFYGSGEVGSGLEGNDSSSGLVTSTSTSASGGAAAGGDSLDTWWSEEDISFFQQHGLFD